MCVRLSHVSALHRTHLIGAAALVGMLAAAPAAHAANAVSQDTPPVEGAPSPAPSAPAPEAPAPTDTPGVTPPPLAPPAPATAAPDAAPATGSAAAAAAAAVDAEAAPEPDVIYLTDGGVLRGTVVEVVPDVEVRIRLATGKVVVAARRNILHFEHLAPVPAEVVPPPAPLHASRAVGWVHIEDSDEAILEHSGPDHGWIGVCASPCDMAVPTDGIYRIVGPNLETSRPFALGARGGEYETLHVHGGSHRAVTGGILLLALGLPLSLSVAFSILGVDRLEGDGAPLTPVERTVEQASLLAGGVAALAGVAMILTNLSTGVSQTVLPAPPTSAGPPPTWSGSGISTLWRDAPQDARALGAGIPPAPPAIGAPVIAVRF